MKGKIPKQDIRSILVEFMPNQKEPLEILNEIKAVLQKMHDESDIVYALLGDVIEETTITANTQETTATFSLMAKVGDLEFAENYDED